MTTPTRILITGASSGLGAALARHYAGPGITLALTGRSAARLGETAAFCEAQGAVCHTRVLDTRHTDELVEWLHDVDQRLQFDLAILNAGIAATRSGVGEGEVLADIIAQADTNLRATLVAAQILGQAMVRRGKGQLAVISSLNGLYPVVEAPTYSATKAGLLAYVRAAREWLEPQGVDIVAVCPGFVRTAIAERYEGPRPFEWSAQKAASHIARQLDKRRRMIAFPLPMLLLIHLARLVPRQAQRAILGRFTASLRPPTG